MNILITGVAGLVGANFSEYLLLNRKNFGINKIFGVDNLSGGYIENLNLDDENFVFIKADLSDKDEQILVEEIFHNKIDYIFHFAAYAAEGLSPFIRQFNYTSNIIPTVFLINMGIKYNIRRFIFTSSLATYGDNTTPFYEDMDLKPIDPYGIAKYACELDLKVAYEQHGMEYCILVPHNIYGKYQNIWDPYRNVLGIWMYQATINKPFTIYGDGNQTRAFSYIDDILPCLWKAAILKESKNERINLGGKYHVSLNDAAKLLSSIVDNNNDFIYLEPRYEVKHAWPTFEKSEKILGYEEKTSLKTGLKTMWNWVIKQKIKQRKTWDTYELDKNIYSYWKF